MTKRSKNLLLTIALIICLIVSVCAAVACDPNANNTTYTVTVQKDDGTPAEGVSVRIRKGGAQFDSKSTDENGKAEFQLASDEYEIALSKLPAHYSVPEDASLKLTAENNSLTVKLEKNFTYTVKLVDQNGNPYYAEGVSVAICTLSGNCLTPVPLEENGIAIMDADPGDYHAKIFNLPEGASIPVDKDDYYTGENFSATKTEMTITVTTAAITSVTDLTPMTDAEKTAYAQTNNAYNSYGKDYVSYKVSKQIDAQDILYFSVTPAITGEYDFFLKSGVSYMYNGETFVTGPDGTEGNGLLPGTLSCVAGKTYYFKAVNNGSAAATAEFVMTAPYSSYINHTGKGGILNVIVGKANTNAIIRFTPTEAGKYTVNVQGTSAIVTATTNEPNKIIATPPADGEYSANPSAVFTAYTSRLGTSIYIAVTAKAAYPAELKVTITKTAAIQDTNTDVAVTEKLTTKYADPTEGQKLIGVPMDGTAQLVYNESDRYYHLGNANGPIVVVNITGNLASNRFESGAALAYMEMIDNRLATYKVISRNANGEDIKNYAVFLRGFNDYEYTDGVHGPEPKLPKKFITEVYYAKFVNKDGVYPMTQELKDFLELFYAANKTSFDWQTNNAADAWLFPCFYYEEISGDTDPISGKYQLSSFTEYGESYKVGESYTTNGPMGQEVTVAATDMTLDIALGEFVIDDKLSEYSYAGVIANNNGVYTFVIPNGDQNENYETIDLVYSVTFDSDKGTVTMTHKFGDDNTVTIVFQRVEA